MLANSKVNITPASRGRLVRKNPNKVLQAVNPNSLLFQEMIMGVLKFTGFQATIEIVQNLKAEEWGLDWHCLRMLMRDCVMRRDWEGGLMIWEQMCRLNEKAGGYMPERIRAAMLALCQVCEQVKRFKELFRIAVGEGHEPRKILQLVLQLLEEASVDDEDNANRAESEAAGSARRNAGAIYTSPMFEQKPQHVVALG
jgi:DNA-binding ferritin-like protein (Dps family)